MYIHIRVCVYVCVNVCVTWSDEEIGKSAGFCVESIRATDPECGSSKFRLFLDFPVNLLEYEMDTLFRPKIINLISQRI